MTSFSRVLLVLLLTAGVAACGGRYSLVEPEKAITIKRSFTVEPGQAWNRINLQTSLFYSHPIDVWTADGDQLNMLLFFAGIANGQTLLPPPREGKKAKKLLAFRSDMTANEVKDVVEATLAHLMDSSIVETRNLRPAKFGGHGGYRFDFSLVGEDEVDRQGFAAGAVVDGKLYCMVFMGTRLYHYGLRLPDAERIFKSVKFVKR